MDADTHTEENTQTAPEETTEPAPPVPPVDEDAEKTTSKTKKPAELEREAGRSLLPLARVQKIMKADKELPTVAKEAALIISIATEEFIERLAEASQLVARRENRVTIQQKDIASVVRRGDEFLFLEEIIPWPDAADAPVRRKPRALEKTETAEKETGTVALDDVPKDEEQTRAGEGDESIVEKVDEDETMTSD